MENKPFFAKYIAVEGEIKEGDDAMIKSHNSDNIPLQRAGTIHKVNKVDESAGRSYIYATEALIPTENAQKVKLFLCSRDIQVGDKYFLDGDEPYEFTRTEEITDFSMIYAYKVIGEISPEARFVKEGDEFSAGEFCYRQFGNGRIYLEQPEWFNYIAVKCPCCGDFK